MNCPKCGKEIQIKTPFCAHCGTPLSQTGQAKAEDYGLKKKLSIWNVHRVKDGKSYGGWGGVVYRLIGLVSLLWPAGLILVAVFQSAGNEFLVLECPDDVFTESGKYIDLIAKAKGTTEATNLAGAVVQVPCVEYIDIPKEQ